MSRGKGATVSCRIADLIQLCLLFQVLYEALHTLCKSTHPAMYIWRSVLSCAQCLARTIDKQEEVSRQLSVKHAKACAPVMIG